MNAKDTGKVVGNTFGTLGIFAVVAIFLRRFFYIAYLYVVWLGFSLYGLAVAAAGSPRSVSQIKTMFIVLFVVITVFVIIEYQIEKKRKWMPFWTVFSMILNYFSFYAWSIASTADNKTYTVLYNTLSDNLIRAIWTANTKLAIIALVVGLLHPIIVMLFLPDKRTI